MNEYLKVVEKYYSKDPKKYHTYWHITNLFELYDRHKEKFHKEFPTLSENTLFEAIAWHDCVYIPGCPMNEEFSAQLYERYYINLEAKERANGATNMDLVVKGCLMNLGVYKAILSTKIGHEKFETPEQKVLHDLDWSGFCNYYHKMLENEEKILYEATCDGRYNVKEVRKNQLNFYKFIVDKDIYVTETFKNLHCNETAKRNLEKRIKEMENENI